MFVNYQPIVDLRTRKVVRAEAFCRFPDNRPGLDTPDEFIKYAEEHGLIKGITDWLLETTLSYWQKLGSLAPESLSLNFSVQNLAEGDLVERVLASLEKHGMKPSRLVLEIDERLLRLNDAVSKSNLDKLNKAGVKLLVDGFGPSLSTFTRLELEPVPVSGLKVDRTIISDLETDPKSRALVKAIAEIAWDAKLELSAQGVEREATVEWLEKFNFNCFQGFLIAPPMDEAAFTDWLARQKPAAAEKA
jgi:EAL domain-containing protein (putative c-di-GMP-specific phosphodiesterase class I)